jgi:AraC-like DNA-binding protein
MIGNAASLAEFPPAETPQLKNCQDLARKHLDNGIRSLFHELTGLPLQAAWTPTWSHRWSDGDLPAVCSWCHRHAAATLDPAGGCGQTDGDSHHLAGVLKPRQEPNFSTCRLGVRHQWQPLIVRGATLGFLFIQTMDDSENSADDRTRVTAGRHKVEAPKSPCCPPDTVVMRLGTLQRERAGMLLKFVAANVETATLAELNEKALGKTVLEPLEPRYQEISWQQTPRQRLPDLPAKRVESHTCHHHQQIVQRMLDYLQSHYHRPIQLGDVADTLKMNACYLSSLFSTTTGVTFHRHLEELRLAKAKKLLADPVMHICEVAFATGFTSAGTFCRTFKAHTGLSPRAWRDGEQGAIGHS